MTEPAFSVRSLAKHWGVSAGKIRQFLRSGELVGTNLALSANGKPQWRITADSVRAFEAARSSAPPPKPARRRNREPAVIDYYP